MELGGNLTFNNGSLPPIDNDCSFVTIFDIHPPFSIPLKKKTVFFWNNYFNKPRIDKNDLGVIVDGNTGMMHKPQIDIHDEGMYLFEAGCLKNAYLINVHTIGELILQIGQTFMIRFCVPHKQIFVFKVLLEKIPCRIGTVECKLSIAYICLSVSFLMIHTLNKISINLHNRIFPNWY